jgi:hypothetical protein
VVPVIGEPTLFGMTASRFSAGTIVGEIDQPGRALRLHCDNPASADQAKAYFEGTLDQIEHLLEWTRADIQRHNQQRARQLLVAVAQRRAKLLRDRDLQASIGYPIMKRQDADSYTVPLRRKRITSNVAIQQACYGWLRVGSGWSVPAFLDTRLGCQLTELPVS